MHLPPGFKHPADAVSIRLELLVFENDHPDPVASTRATLYPCRSAGPKSRRSQRRKNLPVGTKGVDVAVRDTAVKVRTQVVQVLGLA